MRRGIVAIAGLSVLTSACNGLTVQEAALSTRQRIAMVSSAGDGVSPPTTLVLMEDRPGRYVPIATGFAQAPVTAFVAGAGAGIALGIGTYGAGRAGRTTVNSVIQASPSSHSTGGSATGGSATGGTSN